MSLILSRCWECTLLALTKATANLLRVLCSILEAWLFYAYLTVTAGCSRSPAVWPTPRKFLTLQLQFGTKAITLQAYQARWLLSDLIVCAAIAKAAQQTISVAVIVTASLGRLRLQALHGPKLANRRKHSFDACNSP
jgi:hypothetical protein